MDVFRRITAKFNISARDAKIFVVSLLLAFGIWLIHNLSLNYIELVKVPVAARCRIEGHSFSSSGAAVVYARCRASGFAMARLLRAERRKPASVEFAVSDMHPKGGELFYVTAAELNGYTGQIFGGGTRIEALLSDTLMFRFPFENHRKVPVQPVYSIEFRPQYTSVGELVISPDSVVIYGEPYHIEEVDKVFTVPMNLHDLHSSVHGEIGIEKMKGVRISEEKVSYGLDVSRYVEIRASLPVGTRNVPAGRSMTVYPSVASVSFRCMFPVTADPSSSAELYIDYADFSSSLEGQCFPHVENLPDGVLGYRVEPEIFECMEGAR